MITLTFKHRGYNRIVEFKEETYQSIYYQLGEMFNSGEPTFNEDRLIEELIDYDKYQELMDEDFDKAMDYWEKTKELITEEDYKDFIEDLMYSNRYEKYNYELIEE